MNIKTYVELNGNNQVITAPFDIDVDKYNPPSNVLEITEDMQVPEIYSSVLDKILILESSVTPRRMREAALGVQESIDFIQSIDDQIATLRTQL